MIKIYHLLALILLSWTSLDASAEDLAHWTLMIYMSGDNDLESYITHDINRELGRYGSGNGIHVLTLADRKGGGYRGSGNWTSTKLFYIEPGTKASVQNAIEDWGERNLGDPQTLVDFIQWSKSFYPAQRYALVLWGHGWGWRPSQNLWDQTDQDALDLDELLAALEAIGHLDLIAFDACLMQTIEVQATLREYADYIIASQETVSGRGFNYHRVLAALHEQPDMPAESLAFSFYRSMNTDRAISAIKLDQGWDELATAIDRWSHVLYTGLPYYKRLYDIAWERTQGFDDPLFKDLIDAAIQIKSQVPDPEIQAACDRVIQAALGVVLAESHRVSLPRARGISIFWPRRPGDLDEPSSADWFDFEYYREKLTFSQATYWDEFIESYAQTD